MEYEYFMHQALELAESALNRGEFPVGCVLAHRDEIIVSGGRTGTTEGMVNEVDHAEMKVLRSLARLTNHPDPREMTLFCTMEPCLMCYAAIILSGIGCIVYAYEDVMGGGTGCDRSSLSPLYRERSVKVVPHILRKESIELFKSFFSRPENLYWKGSLLADYTLAQ
jgi:tRNA(adenine34) deaminase